LHIIEVAAPAIKFLKYPSKSSETTCYTKRVYRFLQLSWRSSTTVEKSQRW